MSFEILEPLHTISLDIFPQLMWTIFLIGGLTLYLIIRAILKTIL
jgi:hypothetical protein